MNSVLFDLDGTLLPMDLEDFIKVYFGALMKRFASSNYPSEKVMQGVIAGTKAMVKNNGEDTNENVFWKVFEDVTAISKVDIENVFLTFYEEDFPKLDPKLGKSQNMIDAVHILKDKGYRLYLTTNPMFPKEAVYERLKWAGLDGADFEMVTSYDICTASKPNIKYYEEFFVKQHLDVKDCMMVGNDSLEDGVVETLGVPLYLVEDYLIHRSDEPLASKWHGRSEDFLQFVKELEEVR